MLGRKDGRASGSWEVRLRSAGARSRRLSLSWHRGYRVTARVSELVCIDTGVAGVVPKMEGQARHDCFVGR